MDLEDLIKNYPKGKKTEEIDLVIDGGSFNGSYTLGGLMLIKRLEEERYLKVVRISGSSVGSLLAAMYFNNTLDEGFKFDKIIKDYFKKELNLKLTHKLIENEINKMSENEFNLIKDDKLFVSYFKDGKERKIKKRYKNKQELIETLMKSCHVPYLINNNFYCEKDNCVDGIYAYIFDNLERKTIFFDNTNIWTMFNLKNEVNATERIMEGILKTHKLLLKNESSNLCNYLNNWNNNDYFKRNLKLLIIYIIMKSVSIIYDILILLNTLIFKNKEKSEYGEFSYNLNDVFNKCFKKFCLSYIFN